MTDSVVWQASLLDMGGRVEFDPAFHSLQRIMLDEHSWVDYAPHWVSNSDSLFQELLETKDWGRRTRQMYDNKVEEPRLTWTWRAGSGGPLEPKIVDEVRLTLSDRYGVDFDSAGMNLYRDGNDSVAWHGDRIRKEIEAPIVALVSVGEARKFLLKPTEGGRSRSFLLGRGDLLVTGGLTQRTWQHSVPKVAHAGGRISIAFRHDMVAATYTNEEESD
jgi:alkylated DNA repair dioxygenase AlkB